MMNKETSILRKFEERLGLPPLEDATSLLTGEKGKQLSSLLSRLERLSKDTSSVNSAIELLKIVERLDNQGIMEKLIQLLSELNKLSKSKHSQLLIEKLDKFEPLLRELLK